jgi:hypothetical protein
MLYFFYRKNTNQKDFIFKAHRYIDFNLANIDGVKAQSLFLLSAGQVGGKEK